MEHPVHPWPCVLPPPRLSCAPSPPPSSGPAPHLMLQLRVYAPPARQWIKLVTNAVIAGKANVTMQLRPALRNSALTVVATRAVYVNGYMWYAVPPATPPCYVWAAV